MSNIRDCIQKLAQSGDSKACLVCKVDAVNLAQRSIDCTPVDDAQAPFLDVALQATTEGETGIVPVPAIGSYVLVAPTGGCGGVVVATSRVEQVLVQIAETDIRISKEGIVLNGGRLGGLVRVVDLTAQLNKIEKDINSLKKCLATWTPIPSDGGAALKGKVSSWAGNMLTLSKRADYENERVKQ